MEAYTLGELTQESFGWSDDVLAEMVKHYRNVIAFLEGRNRSRDTVFVLRTELSSFEMMIEERKKN